MSVDTLSRIETERRRPQVRTLNKIADALGISVSVLSPLAIKEEKPVEQKARTQEKEEVTVRWRDDEDRLRGETLRFHGKELDSYEHGNSQWTLYECPDGYRVFVEDFDDNTAALYPRATWGQADYLTYESAEELVEEFPLFGEAVGIYTVRDLD